MLGWQVMVYRNPKVSAWQPLARSLIRYFYREPKKLKLGPLIASWYTSVYGVDWINQLVKDGKASDDGGYGYPSQYTVTAGVLLPILTVGLPANISPLVIGDDYVLPAKWSGDIAWEHEAALACHPSDMLTVHAWDQS